MVLDLDLDMDSACIFVSTVHTYADNTNNIQVTKCDTHAESQPRW
jgi:hypothetical protein